jgi:hypothetical protein
LIAAEAILVVSTMNVNSRSERNAKRMDDGQKFNVRS